MEPFADGAKVGADLDHEIIDVIETEERIQSSMGSLMESLRLVDNECLRTKKAVLHQEASMQEKLRESACTLIRDLDSHVIQEKITLTRHIRLLQTLVDRFAILKQLADSSDKQSQIDALKMDLKALEQRQYSTGMLVEYQPSKLSEQFLIDHMSLGTINFRPYINKDTATGRLYDNNMGLPSTRCDINAETCAVGNIISNGCESRIFTENFAMADDERATGLAHGSRPMLPVLTKIKRRKLDADNPVSSTCFKDLNDLHLRYGSRSKTHVTCNQDFRECEEHAELNLSFRALIESDSSLFETNTSPVTSSNHLFDKLAEDQENQLTKCNAIPGLKQQPSYNLSGCGYKYRDVWQPNIIHRSLRSLDEISFKWDSSESVSSDDNSSLSDNRAYSDTLQVDNKQTHIPETKISNLDVWGGAEIQDARLHLERLKDSKVSAFQQEHRESSVADGTQTRKRHVGFLSCRLQTSFKSKRHRTPCVIHDIALLQDGRVVLTDHYHNNIQLFDETFSFAAEEPCPYPMGVSHVTKSKNMAAVTLRRDRGVAIFKAKKDRLEMVRVICVKCDYYIWNVVYKAGYLFVMCDENNIHVIDLNGQQQSVIQSGVSTENGYIRYYDVGDDGTVLYLCTEEGLLCLDRRGKQLWRFTMDMVPDKPLTTYGHTLESVLYCGDRLLATHWKQSSLIELTLDGKYVRHLVTEGLENPRALKTRNGRLAVTQFNPSMKEEGKRTVKIFDLVFK